MMTADLLLGEDGFIIDMWYIKPELSLLLIKWKGCIDVLEY